MQLLLPLQNRYKVYPLGKLNWCDMSWDWGVPHSPVHSSSGTHCLDTHTHVQNGSYSLNRNQLSHFVQLVHMVITQQPPKLLSTMLLKKITGNEVILPVSCIFWIQLRLPVCCAPPNTHKLCGQLPGAKLQCSYRASKPSHSGMSHSCLSGEVRKDNNPKQIMSM